MKARKKMDDLVMLDEVKEIKDVNFKNKIVKVNKKAPEASSYSLLSLFAPVPAKYQYTWFLKQNLSYKDAICEVVAQEVFRLYIHGQPKTRLVEPATKDKSENAYGVMSKAVRGYRALSGIDTEVLSAHLIEGTYRGLGEVLIVSLLVQETDLKFDNMCLDENQQIIKLDGDFCFINLWPEMEVNGKVTAEDLQSLPTLDQYQAFNWLDTYTHSDEITMREKDRAFSDALAKSALVRYEINKALLKVLLTPYQVIRQLVMEIVDDADYRDALCRQLVERRKMLHAAAFKNASFRDYLKTDQAKEDKNQFIHYLLDFKTTGKRELKIAREGAFMERGFSRLVNRVMNEEKDLQLVMRRHR